MQAFQSDALSTSLQQLPSPMDLTRSPSLSLCYTFAFFVLLLIFSGRHVADFYTQACVRVTTHHMCPTEAAYGGEFIKIYADMIPLREKMTAHTFE